MNNKEIFEKLEDFGGSLQIVETEKHNFIEGVEEILSKINDVETSAEELQKDFSEISKDDAFRLLVIGFRRCLAYSSYTHMELEEAKEYANLYFSIFSNKAKYYTLGSIPESEEGVVCGWHGNITNATFELTLFTVDNDKSVMFLIIDED